MGNVPKDLVGTRKRIDRHGLGTISASASRSCESPSSVATVPGEYMTVFYQQLILLVPHRPIAGVVLVPARPGRHGSLGSPLSEEELQRPKWAEEPREARHGRSLT